MHECVSVDLYRKLLVLTDDTRREFIAEVDVFGVGTLVQNVWSAAGIKQLSVLRIVSSKNEVSSRTDFDISCTFGELLTSSQAPST